jgi:hypothetical protein
MTDTTQLAQSIEWFNLFFDDLQRLLQRIATAVSKEFNLPEKKTYYPKPADWPSIPSYCLMGIGGKDSFAVQIYAVLNPALLENNLAFDHEVSFIVVEHPDGENYLRPDGYGMRVIYNQIEQSAIENLAAGSQFLSGRIGSGKRNGTPFRAFQVPLEAFVAGQDINAAIQTRIIDVLKQLPPM